MKATHTSLTGSHKRTLSSPGGSLQILAGARLLCSGTSSAPPQKWLLRGRELRQKPAAVQGCSDTAVPTQLEQTNRSGTLGERASKAPERPGSGVRLPHRVKTKAQDWERTETDPPSKAPAKPDVARQPTRVLSARIKQWLLKEDTIIYTAFFFFFGFFGPHSHDRDVPRPGVRLEL